jgi:class 3 adenylate cyclase
LTTSPQPSPEPVSAQESEKRTERRFVSILFADLVSFTTFSESRDSEDVRNMLTDYFDRSKAIIELYGGEIDKFIGDAVMGVWGAGAAHEDDAERATRAALDLVEMVAELGEELGVPELSARAGVLSGETAVGPGGNEKGLVVGDLVNTASRLQSIAPPGGVFVGAPTRDLIEANIETVAAGEHIVKGKDIPVPAFQALRVISDPSRAGGDLLEGPFVGRDDELRMLKDQLQATGREGRARLVSIVGEGGIGKTRLSQELLRWIDGIAQTIYYHHGRSPSYGDGVTFWALGEMIRQRAGIAEGDDPAKARLRLRTMVAEYLPSEEDQRWVEPRLAGIIGIADMPPGDQGELYAALRTFFQKIAEQGTVLMVFEDMHWADDGLVDFVDELVERTTKHPILVITLARPDLLQRRPDWGSARKRMLSMHLSRLENEPMRELVSGLAPGLPDDMVNRIAGRTAGVPLHAVEFIRMLVNSDQLVKVVDGYEFVGESGDLAVPDSLNAMISARLDRLEPTELALVQDASVLGYTFTVEALAAVTESEALALDGPIRDLVRREVLEFDENPRSPERGQYRFVQSLIREVAYGRLTKVEKVTRHLNVAAQLEAMNDPEVAGVIASHYANAAAADPDNVELRDNAYTSLLAAADRATALHSHRQVVGLLGQAAEITDDETDRLALLVRMSDSAAKAGMDDPEAHARKALERYRELGDYEGEAKASITIARYLAGEFRADQAVALIRPVFDSYPEHGSTVWGELAAETTRALMLADIADRAIEIADEALPILAASGDTDSVLETLINRGTALGNNDRNVEAYVMLLGVAEYARRNDLLRTHVRAMNNLQATSATDDARGQLDDEFLELVNRTGDQSWIMRMPFFVGGARFFAGEFDEATKLIDSLDRANAFQFWVDWTDVLSLMIRTVSEGASPEMDAAFRGIVDQYRNSDDPQLVDNVASFDAQFETFSGNFEAVRHLALAYEPAFAYSTVFGNGLIAAAMLRDAEALDSIIAKLMEGSQGRVVDAQIGFGNVYAALLAGDHSAAVRAYADADALWSEVGDQLHQAVARSVTAFLAGTDGDLGEQAARDAYKFLSDAGADGLLAVFADTFAFITDVDGSEEVAV